MTLAPERVAGLTEGGSEVTSLLDRRAPAVEPRRSWASPQPFLSRATAHNRRHVRDRGWARVSVQYRNRVLLADVAVALLVTGAMLPGVHGLTPRSVYLVAGTTALFVLMTAVLRGYDVRRLGEGPGEFQALMRGGAATALALMGFSYATMAEISRLLVFVGVPLVALLALALRYVLRRFLHRARARGMAMKRTLVVGDRSDVEHIVTDLTRAPHHGFAVTGVCLSHPELDGSVAGVPVVGAVADVPQVVVDRAIEVVVVKGGQLGGEALRRLSWALDRAGAQLVVVPGLLEVTTPRLSVLPAAGMSLLEVEVGASRARLLGKAVLDRTLGVLVLVLASPVIAAAALAVRLTSRGPAFYRQTRVGVDGERFTLWKLRSMYVDADERRAQLVAQAERDGVLFKMERDPRVTPVGRVLRRFSIDELPQLFNVVRGDMSLVGPRPPLEEEVEQYADPVHRRLRVKPGLTGLWQVSGRSDLSWDEAVRLDLRYVDNWSLTMDLTILWKTARVVLTGSGAY